MPPQDSVQPAPPHLPLDLSVVPPEDRVLLAVSGGADSMALVLALHLVHPQLVVGHVNHGLRGEQSDADEAFVRQRANELGLKCVCQRVEVAVGPAGRAGEAAARQARYEALIQMAHETNCRRVATGHTASDQLETSLINWLRGAAVAGLTGMEIERPLAPGLLLARPLLEATRQQTRAYCQALEQTWCEDASNQCADYLRNRVRHELLPLLAQISRRAPAQLELQAARAATLLRDDFECLDCLATQEMGALSLPSKPNVLALDGLAFRALHPALQRRVLRCAVMQLQGDLLDLDAARVEAARRHIAAAGRRKVWQWRRGVNVEWTGPMSGNRIRIWLVGHNEPLPGSQNQTTGQDLQD